MEKSRGTDSSSLFMSDLFSVSPGFEAYLSNPGVAMVRSPSMGGAGGVLTAPEVSQESGEELEDVEDAAVGGSRS